MGPRFDSCKTPVNLKILAYFKLKLFKVSTFYFLPQFSQRTDDLSLDNQPLSALKPKS